MNLKIIILIAIVATVVVTLIGFNKDIALLTTPSKKALEQTNFQKQTDVYFWQQLHDGNYDSLPQIIDSLTLAYL